MEHFDEYMFTGPPPPLGPMVQVQSLATNLPAGCGAAESYWSLIATGGEAHTEVSPDRWDPSVYYAPDEGAASRGQTSTKHAAFLQASELWDLDAGFHGLREKEAKLMVPEQRLVLRTGYQALADVGLGESLKGSRISTYVGDCANESATYCPALDECRQNGTLSAATASRISHLFGLRGGACSFDTACSSSLVALGHAHSQLRLAPVFQDAQSRQSSGALVIGVRVLFGPEGFVGLGAAGFLSLHGRCFTFDSSAQGFGRGEGCCSVFLARDDPEDGEDLELHLASVSGSSVNQDGRSASLTAPHGPSQQSCIRSSLRMANVSPDKVAVAECHGTGTSLGDPIEVGALRGVMYDRRQPLLMTSSKSNVGHAESAAGLNGLAKCVLMLMTSASAPNVHLRSLNPNLDTNGFPCLYESECVDADQNSQNIGVSSFGFGGTNARADLWGHCVRFYIFRRIPDFKNFKNMYRARMDNLQADSATADRMVEEANYAFFLNTRIFQELDSLAGFEAEPVPPPASAPAASHAEAAAHAAAAGCPFASLAAQGLAMPDDHPGLADTEKVDKELAKAPEQEDNKAGWRLASAAAVIALSAGIRAMWT
ncbi:Phthiocerol/phenolphthiocerol synthesis polyketide synthase type I PpsD [Symbiodinium microadriaticum]|uniref:Phthiocerol/phenolphthiocerol synthesis polyketide synthase type I PpsD n=1 Tax=Symbiodinium microadriaticum TaxID=2951 RepID=A0A1Q9EJF0_SYMMI|nr:Phthiocerol/phenolphthiocerol synthesis polyketide synthase type I PpsD [Symbiodinium microadriaticum]